MKTTMKNSAILNVLHKTKPSNKQQNVSGGKNWIHSPEALKSNHVVYLVKFLGCTEVDQPKGTDVIREGIRKLKFNQQLKKAEGAKPTKVELTISVDGVTIQEPKSKRVMHKYPLHRISYCADDKLEKRFFSFIAKEAEEGKHMCFVFVSDKLAEEITLTIGQAFDLAYRRFLDNQGKDVESRKQVILAQRKAQVAEAELVELRARLKDLSTLVPSAELDKYLRQKQISEILEVIIPEENIKNLRQNSDATSNGSSREVINLISDFGESSDDGVDTNSGSSPPPPVPPRTLATLANSIVGGAPPSPTTGDLLGEIDDEFDGDSPAIAVVGTRLENINWSELEDFESPPTNLTSSGTAGGGNNKVVTNGNHAGLANGGSPVKLTPPPGKTSGAPPPLPARNNPVTGSNTDLLSNIFASASSPSLANMSLSTSSLSTSGLAHSSSSSSVSVSPLSPPPGITPRGGNNNPFASPSVAAAPSSTAFLTNGHHHQGKGRAGDDPFGMGKFDGDAAQKQGNTSKDGFGRVLMLEPKKINEFSLESLDPLRN